MNKWVYFFSAEKNEGNKEMRSVLGGKGANLAEMCSLKLPVPCGFTVTTEACEEFYKNERSLTPEIKEQVLASLKEVEALTNKEFGSVDNPLLFSVRSGAAVSMPGMMDTVLNLGLNDQVVTGLAKKTKNPRFAWDSYRRFIQMYANVVMGLNVSFLESTLEDLKEARGVELDTELTAEDFEELVQVYKSLILQESGKSFPQNPIDQLWAAISAVFKSWNNARAHRYRELNQLSHQGGTAVNVQSMVFGNLGETSGTGVCFTRDPSTGERKFFGEYLLNAQGEDVVAGIRNPGPINQESKSENTQNQTTLQEVMPKVYDELVKTYQQLEQHYRDMQDIEFTIEENKLYILQTRSGKRTTQAALKIAVDLVTEKVLSKAEALKRIRPEDLNQLLHPRLDPKAKRILLAQGLPASPGAASGLIAFTPEQVQALAESGKKTLLVRIETSPEDINGMALAEGILTARGGMTSHAAVVARGMGKPCVVGCQSLMIDEIQKTVTIDGRVFKDGDYLTIEGAQGQVFEGEVETIAAQMSKEFELFMSWADEYRTLKVRANADNPEDSKAAIRFGAEGIGLCRTEHMFFDPERILAVRQMIFATSAEERKRALVKILPFQKRDFLQLFEVMTGCPVNIRLLDPPLHEFLPHSLQEKKELAESLGLELKTIEDRMDQLSEHNPMLGHRGCRLAITYPEIYATQVQAIILAALDCHSKGIVVLPEIMIPLISSAQELKLIRELVTEVAEEEFKKFGQRIDYKIGTMIELPRACITAKEIAKHADFFSFGTNDLTQTTYGLSRDDSSKFLPEYTRKEIYARDPFVEFDQEGLGPLVEMAIKGAKDSGRPLSLGICGEHGGDPASIAFFHQCQLDYVSCSPFRIPIARLAAAQAALG